MNGTDLPRKQPSSYGCKRHRTARTAHHVHGVACIIIPGIFFANPSHCRNLFNSPCHLFVTKMGPIRTLNSALDDFCHNFHAEDEDGGPLVGLGCVYSAVGISLREY